MRTTLLLLLSLSLITGCASTQPSYEPAAISAPPKILPEPVELKSLPGSYHITSTTTLNAPEGPATNALSSLNLPPSNARHNAIVLKIDKTNPTLGDEGYTLDSNSSGVLISANTPCGLFYGTQTLRQMITEDQSVPACHIVDYPRFRYRGLMLDSGRHIQSMDYIKSLIDRLAQLKMNTFHWHLTEDQGWRLEIKKYPRLTEFGAWRNRTLGESNDRYGGFFTQDQAREIVKYAQDRCITVIPEIEMPGHSTAAVASYPALGCTGKQMQVLDHWGISPDVYCAGNEETYKFCEDVLTEVMDIFPSKTIHIGGDECPKTNWKVCPKCQAKMKELGLKDEDALQGYFTSRIAKFLADHGRHLQGWNEIMNGTTLPQGVIVQQWNYPHSATVAAQAGLDVVTSPTTHCYFDYDYKSIPTRKVLDFEPVPEDLQPELTYHIKGPQANVWTERIADNARCDVMIFPRLYALAEVGWSPKGERDWDSFLDRAKAYMTRNHADDAESMQRLTNDYDFANKIGSWSRKTITTQPKELEWDATKIVKGEGTYKATFSFDKGPHGLTIDEAVMECSCGHQETDTHKGFTGAMNKDNEYTFHVAPKSPDMTWKLKATVHGEGGNNSAGSVYLKKVQ
jgi:hexosaminidase